MPRVRFKPMVVEIQGTMYEVVFKKSSRGNTIVTKRPDMSNVKWSKAQKGNWSRMEQANDYAKTAMADPKVRLIYEKRAVKEHRVPYRLAVSDYYKGKDLLSRKTKAPPTKKQGRRKNGKD
jgi:hypothetical protein